MVLREIQRLPIVRRIQEVQQSVNMPTVKFTWDEGMPGGLNPTQRRLFVEERKSLPARAAELVSNGIYRHGDSTNSYNWVAVRKSMCLTRRDRSETDQPVHASSNIPSDLRFSSENMDHECRVEAPEQGSGFLETFQTPTKQEASQELLGQDSIPCWRGSWRRSWKNRFHVGSRLHLPCQQGR